MADIATAYVHIVPTTRDMSSALTEAMGGTATTAGKLAGSNIAASLGSALMTGIAGIGLEQVIEKAISAGGDLEQSFGGLETIYGDAAEQAKQFAFEASKAGISANEYAEQAVSFGASLKQAFGGDTEKAVQAANTAIMDMTDNAAKMGTPIENIQTAYQGFAKQNYTMLDNLKLGYGGTKTEMERLLKDAQKISGVKYDISNLGDVYDAIHVIQGELGLTGVAAEEAKSTLQGSFNAVKASLTNFLAALSTGQDIEQPLTDFIMNIGNYLFNNLVPALTNILAAIPGVVQTLITTLAPTIGTSFTEIFNDLPGLLDSGVQIINQVVDGIIAGLPGFISSAYKIMGDFVTAIMSALPSILSAGVQIILNLVQGLWQNLPEIATTAIQAMSEFIFTIGSHLPEILQKGIEIIGELIAGLISAIPDLVASIPEIVNAIKDAVMEFDWLGLGGDIISGIANGISNAAGKLVDAAKTAAKAAFDSAVSFFSIGSPSKLMRDEVGEQIPAGMAIGIEDKIPEVVKAMSTLNTESFNAISSAVSGSIMGAGDAIGDAMERYKVGEFGTLTDALGTLEQNRYNPRDVYNPAEDFAHAIENAAEDQNVTVNVTLQGDAEKMFRVVEQHNTRRTRATNYNSLAFRG